MKTLRQMMDLIENAQQGVAEATGDSKFDAMIGKMQPNQLDPNEVKYFQRMDLLFAKLGEMGHKIVRNPSTWRNYEQIMGEGNHEEILGWIEKYLGRTAKATRGELSKLMDIVNDVADYNTITEFAYAVRAGDWESSYIEPWEEYKLEYARTNGAGLGEALNSEQGVAEASPDALAKIDELTRK